MSKTSEELDSTDTGEPAEDTDITEPAEVTEIEYIDLAELRCGISLGEIAEESQSK